MSRSKEGKDIQRQDRQITEPSQSDIAGTRQSQTPERDNYRWGRESRREFPRRSTSRSEPLVNETSQQNRSYDYQRDEAEEARRNRMNRYSQQNYENRSPVRDYGRDYDERDSRRGSSYRTRDQGYGRQTRFTAPSEYGYSERYDRTPYRQDERSSDYQDQHQRGNYARTTDYSDRYETEQPVHRRTYDRTDSTYRDNRALYNEPYYRDTYIGRPEEYGPEIISTHQAYGSYEDMYTWGDTYGRRYLRCGDIMTKDVTTCELNTPLRQVADKMEDEDVGSIPVVENDRLVGIVTDRDIVCRILATGRDTKTATAADAMSQDIVTASREDSVIDAIHKMGENQIRRLPVVDQNYRLRGIIAMADIALEAERDRDLAEALEQISEPTPFQSHRRQ